MVETVVPVRDHQRLAAGPGDARAVGANHGPEITAETDYAIGRQTELPELDVGCGGPERAAKVRQAMDNEISEIRRSVHVQETALVIAGCIDRAARKIVIAG